MLYQSPEFMIGRHLAEGERLLWSDRPRQGIILRWTDIFLIPFSLVWCGFAVVWIYLAATTEVPWFAIFGLPFVLVGLNMLVGRFVIDARRRARTWYGITDRRVIIVTGTEGEQVVSLDLHALSEMKLEQGSSGSGTISFGPRPDMPAFRIPGRLRSTHAFDAIEEAARVYQTIRSARLQDGDDADTGEER